MFRLYRKHAIPGLLLLFTLVSLILPWPGAFSPTRARADYTVTISPSQKYQTIQGWGTSLAWWANIIGGWSDSQRMAVANKLFDPVNGIGLNVVRYNFGADGPGNVCHNQMRPGGNVPSFEPTQGNYDWNQDANQLWFAQAAQARGADIFEGAVYSAPAWMLMNNCTAGGTDPANSKSPVENLKPAFYGDFANYIATIVQHFHDSFGILMQTVEPLNEPWYTTWNSNGRQEGMDVSAANGDQAAIINDLAAALAQNGASAYTSIAAPDDFSVSGSLIDYSYYSSSTIAHLSQWNTHTYSGSDTNRDSAYTSIGQSAHKNLWMSEWGTGSQGSQIGAALALSHEILDDEQHLHPSAWVIWQAVNSGGGSPTDDWGLANMDSSNNITYPTRYYAMGNYSKFVREGSYMIGNSDASTFTAYNAQTQTLVIVTTNSTSSNEIVTYDLSKFNTVAGLATPYQTTASENLQPLSPIASSNNNAFSSTLPAQSITTFVIPNVT